jgi:hypothetical protein
MAVGGTSEYKQQSGLTCIEDGVVCDSVIALFQGLCRQLFLR